MNGILAIDKSFGMTSHDVISILRRLSGQRDIGHAGTLDPMATGLLMVCMGTATRLSDFLMNGDKWYLGRIAFGTTTDTDDALGRPLAKSVARFDTNALTSAVATQVGSLMQVPPSYAAIKRDGVAAYKSARAGRPVSLAARQVQVHRLDVLRFNVVSEPVESGANILTTAEADVLVHCGKGTYIRSIARDMGEFLGCGAHLSGLRRLASGSFSTLDAVAIDTLEAEVAHSGRAAIETRLARQDRALSDMPAMVVGEAGARSTRTGMPLHIPIGYGSINARLYDGQGVLLALATVDQSAGAALARPRKVFAAKGAR